MRKIIFLAFLAFLVHFTGYAQNVPSGMKYQAVARDYAGQPLANRSLTIRIDLKSNSPKGAEVFYSEEHYVTTNQLGLFDLVIGEGKNVGKGSFAEIPWSEEDIWMAVSLRDKSGFSAVTETKLLAVPYAFHAGTANKLSIGVNKGGTPDAGVPANVWSTFGNSGTSPLTDKLGTTDNQDLVFVTNNIERLRITKTGDISIANNLKVGVDVEVGNDLYVKKNVFLNTVSGNTTNNGNFTVANAKITTLTGVLNVDGDADFNSALNVDGATTINNTLTVTKNSTDHVATFYNTNNADGDGISIKLGKIHPRWNGSAYANVPNLITQGVETQVNQIRDWVYGNDSFSWDDLINLIPSQYMVGTFCKITNYVTDQINTKLGLPINISQTLNNALGLPYNIAAPINNALGLPFNLAAPINSALGLPYEIAGETVIPAIPALNIPSIPSLTIPAIPSFSIPAIPQLNCDALPSIEFPVFEFDDVTNSLTKENEFITFVDKDNRKLGAIRAQSIQNFSYDYFDGQKLLDLTAEFIGIDIVDDFLSIMSGISEMINAYNDIGVEYSSGNGDYAEWLERENPKEDISYGDIVAVKGGKITKDLRGAQQIMAVSKKPIVLGNVPEAKRTSFGNNIAFMGQIPVKVVGAVQSGDYIVAKGEIPGYGVAIHPKDMTVEDYKLAVGRSWDNNPKAGPKMVNTVVGVHNHDFLNIIANLQQKAGQTEERLKAIESALNIGAQPVKEQPKKGFK